MTRISRAKLHVYLAWLLAHRCWRCNYPVWFHPDSPSIWPHEYEAVGLRRALAAYLRGTPL